MFSNGANDSNTWLNKVIHEGNGEYHRNNGPFYDMGASASSLYPIR